MVSERTAFIYAFFTKATGACFYVGQTVNIDTRLSAHRSSGKFCDETDMSVVLESGVLLDDAGNRERHWIGHFRSLGHDLENKNNGGESPKRVFAKRYFVVNCGEYFDSRGAINKGLGISISAVKAALASSQATGAPAKAEAWTVNTVNHWIIDLEAAPDWEYCPDFQI